MPESLVIVESPAKAKTLERYLGSGYKVLASYGHVRDLLPKNGAVDPENNFSMQYEIVEKNEKWVNAIAKALKKTDILYLATDPDREGEAISWHLYELLKERGVLDNKTTHRVVFYEVTKNAVNEAIANPRELSESLINAQQTRRALDYLVGFNLSPLLWKKIQGGLSAGRVQSPALRMIVEREKEIEAFTAKEYWTIEATLETETTLKAKLVRYQGEALKQFSITSEDHASKAKNELMKLADGNLHVKDVKKSQRKRQPAPPFMTSTLQQDAIRKLGFTAQRVMRCAQQLYEGIDTGQGATGLITYMRTDSLSLSQDATTETRAFISKHYGKDTLPDKPKYYKTRSKNAQEAHEAIRPTSVNRTPEQIKHALNSDQYKLYNLIWKRTVACQMNHAVIDMVSAEMTCGNDKNIFRATSSTITKPGFMKVYYDTDEEQCTLPPLKKDQQVKLHDLITSQHFTEPPPRYTEASLVKSLEEYGIGRPSTYASIIQTLNNRNYVEMDKKRFIPTDTGRLVNNFLADHFTDYVDYEFTARLEDELDEISRGEKEWQPVMKNFWDAFSNNIKEKETSVSREEAIQARVVGNDPKTGLEVSVRMGRYGSYAQIGTKDDEDKPKFASLRANQRIDTISFEEVMELFKLPRILGETAEQEEVTVSIGRFGPYVRYGNKFVSLKQEYDPYTVGLDVAIELIAEKKKADQEKNIKEFPEGGISVLKGRYGPYITDGKKNAKIPKDKEPEHLTLEDCQKLLAKAPSRGKRGRAKKS